MLQEMDGLTYRQRQQLSGHTSIMEPEAHLNLILLGKVKAGKSASGNTILGRQAFVTNESSFSVTQNVAVQSGNVFGFPVTVYDTPGLYESQINDNEMQLQYQKVFQRYRSGPCVFLLVIKADRFTEGDRRTVEKIEEFLGPHCLINTWILFTGGDQLEGRNMTIQEFLERNNALKTLEKYNQRYHVFNNKKKGTSDQTRLLLAKIIQTSFVLNASEGGGIPRQITTVTTFTLDLDFTCHLSRRIVLLGKSGVGKSAAGNTILGRREFISEMSTSSVTRECSEAQVTVSGRSVSVVDTPGFFDTQMKPEELEKEIARSVYISSPGPHAFLIVLHGNDRYTERELAIPQMIEMLFGQEVLKYSIILFTHGDLLEEETVEEIIEWNSDLRHLVDQCGGRYHVFNNRDQNNREQVNDLLQKIDTMIEQNGGGHYSNQMFEDAHRFRREEEEQRQREEEWRKQQEEIENVRMQNIRTECEAQRSDLERQREEKWIKPQENERDRKEKGRTFYKAQSHSGFEQYYRKNKLKFSFLVFVIGVGAVCGAFLVGAVGAVAGHAGAAVVSTAVGKTVGVVGTAVGKTVGVVGTAAGNTVGVVGTAVGKTVGVVGTAVGKTVGVVGTAAGNTVGVVGTAVGKTVGVVGTAAGKTVGVVGTAAGNTVSKAFVEFLMRNVGQISLRVKKSHFDKKSSNPHPSFSWESGPEQ